MYTTTAHHHNQAQSNPVRLSTGRVLSALGAVNCKALLYGSLATALLLWSWNLLAPTATANAYAAWLGVSAIALGAVAFLQMWSMRSLAALVVTGAAAVTAYMGLEAQALLVAANALLAIASFTTTAEDSDDPVAAARVHFILLALIAPWLV